MCSRIPVAKVLYYTLLSNFTKYSNNSAGFVIMYLNDFHGKPWVFPVEICFKHYFINLYADDTLFYFANSKVDTVSQALNDELHNVAN